MKKELQEWFNDNDPKETMIYRQSFVDQFLFVRDNIRRARYLDIPIGSKLENVYVISTHTSKSIKLPVYSFIIRDVKIIMRNNFYNWMVSIISPVSIKNINNFKLFKDDEQIHSVYCEGFKDEWVFGSYKDNNKQFTIQLPDNYELYTFLRILTTILFKN